MTTINMRENYDWVDDKLEMRYGTTQYNIIMNDYINTMSPLEPFNDLMNNTYVTYNTPFFGQVYLNTDNEMEIEDEDTRMNVEIEEPTQIHIIYMDETEDDEYQLPMNVSMILDGNNDDDEEEEMDCEICEHDDNGPYFQNKYF